MRFLGQLAEHYAVWDGEKCTHLHKEETKEPLLKSMAQDRKASSAVLHLKEQGCLFEDSSVHILHREDMCLREEWGKLYMSNWNGHHKAKVGDYDTHQALTTKF